jgi:hypothetical protein
MSVSKQEIVAWRPSFCDGARDIERVIFVPVLDTEEKLYVALRTKRRWYTGVSVGVVQMMFPTYLDGWTIGKCYEADILTSSDFTEDTTGWWLTWKSWEQNGSRSHTAAYSNNNNLADGFIYATIPANRGTNATIKVVAVRNNSSGIASLSIDDETSFLNGADIGSGGLLDFYKYNTEVASSRASMVYHTFEIATGYDASVERVLKIDITNTRNAASKKNIIQIIAVVVIDYDSETDPDSECWIDGLYTHPPYCQVTGSEQVTAYSIIHKESGAEWVGGSHLTGTSGNAALVERQVWIPIGGAVRTDNEVLVTTDSPHRLFIEEYIEIFGVPGPTLDFDGRFKITSIPDDNQFTYDQVGNDETSEYEATGDPTYYYKAFFYIEAFNEVLKETDILVGEGVPENKAYIRRIVYDNQDPSAQNPSNNSGYIMYSLTSGSQFVDGEKLYLKKDDRTSIYLTSSPSCGMCWPWEDWRLGDEGTLWEPEVGDRTKTSTLTVQTRQIAHHHSAGVDICSYRVNLVFSPGQFATSKSYQWLNSGLSIGSGFDIMYTIPEISRTLTAEYMPTYLKVANEQPLQILGHTGNTNYVGANSFITYGGEKYFGCEVEFSVTGKAYEMVLATRDGDQKAYIYRNDANETLIEGDVDITSSVMKFRKHKVDSLPVIGKSTIIRGKL